MFATEEPIQINATLTDAHQSILSEEAQRFLAKLARAFEPRRRALLALRRTRQQEIDAGAMPQFLPSTAHIRNSEWQVAPIPADLLDRRVEITGPVDRKMIINALNSGANVFMADFEDSHSPTWSNVMDGQVNLRDAVRGTISYTSAEGKRYQLCEEPAVLMVRPRGWHLVEKHFLVDGEPMSAALFDFGLFFFHNAKALISNGTGPYFYLPKLESRLEARLWNDVFILAQHQLGISRGTIRATVLIETILAAFEMDEILWELREHSAGLNCGRWDYIFSFIKKFRNQPGFVLPDRALVTMDCHFLRSYTELLIHTCHRRGVHAMGGMAAQIPIKNYPEANQAASTKVRQDKLREVWAGHDGTWVAHPALVSIAREVFDTYMPFPNQIEKKPAAGVTAAAITAAAVTAADLLTVPTGEVTREGLNRNIDIGLQYLVTWLSGNGCVPIYDLMEDAATAEICRAQVWQWIQYESRLSDGQCVTPAMVREILQHQRARLGGQFPARDLALACRLFEGMTINPEFPEFLTLSAYELLD